MNLFIIIIVKTSLKQRKFNTKIMKMKILNNFPKS